MNTKLILILVLIFGFGSCSRNTPKDFNKDILSSSLKEIDSVFYVNRPLTSYFLDSVVECRPSNYFKDYQDIFNHRYSFIGKSIDDSKQNIFFYSYKFNGLRYKTIFIYEKEKNNWIFKGVKVLESHTPLLRPKHF